MSVTNIDQLLGKLCKIYEIKRKYMLITIRVLLCILKDFLLFLDIFRRHLVLNVCWYKSNFLRKMKKNKKHVTGKSHNSLFLRDRT